MCYSLAKRCAKTIQDDINKLVVRHLSIDIESINIVQAFLDIPCLLEIAYLVKYPMQLKKVAIVLPNSILDLFPNIEPTLVNFPLFQ